MVTAVYNSEVLQQSLTLLHKAAYKGTQTGLDAVGSAVDIRSSHVFIACPQTGGVITVGRPEPVAHHWRVDHANQCRPY